MFTLLHRNKLISLFIFALSGGYSYNNYCLSVLYVVQSNITNVTRDSTCPDRGTSTMSRPVLLIMPGPVLLTTSGPVLLTMPESILLTMTGPVLLNIPGQPYVLYLGLSYLQCLGQSYLVPLMVVQLDSLNTVNVALSTQH